MTDIMRPGDLLLVKGNTFESKIIRWITRCPFTHMCIVVNKKQVVEATANFLRFDIGNVRLSPLSKYAKNDTAILRPQLSKWQHKKLLRAALSKVGCSYDNLGLLRIAARLFFPIKIFRPQNKYNCTSFIRESLRTAGLRLNYFLPTHFLTSKKFKYVH